MDTTTPTTPPSESRARFADVDGERPPRLLLAADATAAAMVDLRDAVALVRRAIDHDADQGVTAEVIAATVTARAIPVDGLGVAAYVRNRALHKGVARALRDSPVARFVGVQHDVHGSGPRGAVTLDLACDPVEVELDGVDVAREVLVVLEELGVVAMVGDRVAGCTDPAALWAALRADDDADGVSLRRADDPGDRYRGVRAGWPI